MKGNRFTVLRESKQQKCTLPDLNSYLPVCIDEKSLSYLYFHEEIFPESIKLQCKTLLMRIVNRKPPQPMHYLTFLVFSVKNCHKFNVTKVLV